MISVYGFLEVGINSGDVGIFRLFMKRQGEGALAEDEEQCSQRCLSEGGGGYLKRNVRCS